VTWWRPNYYLVFDEENAYHPSSFRHCWEYLIGTSPSTFTELKREEEEADPHGDVEAERYLAEVPLLGNQEAVLSQTNDETMVPNPRLSIGYFAIEILVASHMIVKMAASLGQIAKPRYDDYSTMINKLEFDEPLPELISSRYHDMRKQDEGRRSPLSKRFNVPRTATRTTALTQRFEARRYESRVQTRQSPRQSISNR
jgi:hypothetical protein